MKKIIQIVDLGLDAFVDVPLETGEDFALVEAGPQAMGNVLARRIKDSLPTQATAYQLYLRDRGILDRVARVGARPQVLDEPPAFLQALPQVLARRNKGVNVGSDIARRRDERRQGVGTSKLKVEPRVVDSVRIEL